jgi:hypothetical protein
MCSKAKSWATQLHLWLMMTGWTLSDRRFRSICLFLFLLYEVSQKLSATFPRRLWNQKTQIGVKSEIPFRRCLRPECTDRCGRNKQGQKKSSFWCLKNWHPYRNARGMVSTVKKAPTSMDAEKGETSRQERQRRMRKALAQLSCSGYWQYFCPWPFCIAHYPKQDGGSPWIFWIPTLGTPETRTVVLLNLTHLLMKPKG